jgi:beta-lysine 5,6-aminomutase alpha subunit
MNTARHFGDEIEFKRDGIVERRAQSVLRDAHALLERVASRGLMESIEAKAFADVKRSPDGGRGFDGVFPRGANYWNPFEAALSRASAVR